MISPTELNRSRRTVVVVDMVESVKLMRAHEDDTIQRWLAFVSQVRESSLAEHGGRLVKSLGDGLLLTCDLAPRAVALAFDLQERVATINRGLDESRRIRLRVGVHVCELVEDELDVYGAGVNLAARIAAVARPGGVAASDDVVDDLLPGVDALLEDAGLCFLKHLVEPVHVYHLSPPSRSIRAVAASPRAIAAFPGSEAVNDAVVPTTVAVMGMAPADSDPQAVTLAELLSDTLVVRLSSVPAVRVISRLSAEQFRLRGLSAQDIARQSGTDYIVGGRLHRSGGQSLLYLELIEARTNTLAWASTFRLDAGALLRHDEEVTPAIAQEVLDQIAHFELRRVGISPLPNLSSQSLQFSAIHLMHRRSRTDFQRAGEILTHLVERHPRSAAPHAWTAQWHVLSITKGLGFDRHDADRALDHTHRALDLNPDSAMSMAMEAFVQCHMKLDLDSAQQRIAEAVEINPSEPWSWLVRSTVESFLGRGDLAWQAAMRARELSPMDPLKHYYDGLAASAAVAAERYDEAMQLAHLSLSKDARHLPTVRALAIAQVHLGRAAEARGTVAKLMQLQPDFTLAQYIETAPQGGQEMRRKWAEALRAAGAPLY
jgi:adenylate cyclase